MLLCRCPGLGLLIALRKCAAQRAKGGTTHPLGIEQRTGNGEISPDEIEICKTRDGSDWVLGMGSFGVVYKGLRRGVQEVAVKKLHCSTEGDAWLRLLAKEVFVLKKVSYDRNIVQFYGACLQDQASAMLVMEYMAVRVLDPRDPSAP